MQRVGMMTKRTTGKLRKCGEDNLGFYDRVGDYFRAGYNPRNNFGRFLADEPNESRSEDKYHPAGYVLYQGASF